MTPNTSKFRVDLFRVKAQVKMDADCGPVKARSHSCIVVERESVNSVKSVRSDNKRCLYRITSQNVRRRTWSRIVISIVGGEFGKKLCLKSENGPKYAIRKYANIEYVSFMYLQKVNQIVNS
jgi:hypothetical protein